MKPLYDFVDGRRLVFASEIKAILAHPDIVRDVDPKGLLNYLAYGHAVAPDTMYRGIRKLLPGHSMRVRGKDIAVRQWWDVMPAAQTMLSEEECAREVRRLLEDSVRLRLISDVPLGAFLSGGLDSSAIGYYMTKAATRTKAFSIGFEDPRFDESDYARLVARHLGVDHHLEVFSEDRVKALVPKIPELLDEPMGDQSIFPTYLLSTVAREGVTVALAAMAVTNY